MCVHVQVEADAPLTHLAQIPADWVVGMRLFLCFTSFARQCASLAPPPLCLPSG